MDNNHTLVQGGHVSRVSLPVKTTMPHSLRWTCLPVLMLLLAGMACATSPPAPAAPRIARLPTLTPTANPNGPPTASPPAASAPLPAPPAADVSGWGFVGVTPQTGAATLQLVGEFINQTGQPQQVNRLTGTFFDAQQQAIAGPDNTRDDRPVSLIAPGEQQPFRLTVPGLAAAADFALTVSAQPTTETTRRDFTFSGLESSIQAGDYCLTGVLQNPGDPLQQFLVIALLLYDDQGNLLNFSSFTEPYFSTVTGQLPLDFEICAAPLGQTVSRHELKAWGR